MAGTFNPINFISYQNPEKGLRLQQQIALAQQLMDQGKTPDDINKLANPGGFVVPYSPLQGISKAGSQIAGSYLQQKALADALQPQSTQAPDMMGTATNAAINSEGGMGPATAQDVSGKYQQGLAAVLGGQSQGEQPTQQEMYLESFAPGMGKAQFEQRMKAQNFQAEAQAKAQYDKYTDAQGVNHPLMSMPGIGPAAQLQPNYSAMMPQSLQRGMNNQAGGNPPLNVRGPDGQPTVPGINEQGNKDYIYNQGGSASPQSMTPTQAKGIQDVFGADADKPSQPVVLSGASDEASSKPLAGDGKPFLPNQDKLYTPDPSGTPKYNTENSNTGVNQTKIFQEADNKANEAFTSNAQSLEQEKSRINNLVDVYKQVQAGTLTAQNPELANKLVAYGIIKDPAEIKNIAGVQTAMQNHILQVLQQIKDTNANLGGQPTRTFGSEIQNLMDKGAETSAAQPEALWNILSQAQGIVDHHLDMVNGWSQIGGLGNRQANGFTMRPDDYARNFIQSHKIEDYKTNAQKEMGPFKGMPGNNGESKTYDSPESIGNAYKNGKITKDQAVNLLKQNHGFQ